jgi:citrate lyase subunit beta/citryl-CoA lyase
MRDLGKVRSVLVVPGHDGRKVAKARTCGADLIVFDLEDAVPEAFKDKAAGIIAAAARPGDAIRVNGVGSHHYLADMDLVGSTGAMAMVPKVEIGHLIAIDRCSAILTIESPSAVLDARAIAAHSTMVAFGRADFMAAIGVLDPFSRLIEHAMLEVAMAAHAEGKPSSDGPCYINDEAVLAAEIGRARGAAFTSKGCIHPRQVAAVTAGMGRGAKERELASLILGAVAPEGLSVFDFRGTVVSPALLAASREVARNG